ncbi:hypothetical protein QM012_005044 [Aureobasidium pullulans]|uniref:Protein kinase domain-containing protein n=1 Tax=Aureobasidium pullulans TaxID=5580 RepID=A0ABR0T688_AURPU
MARILEKPSNTNLPLIAFTSSALVFGVSERVVSKTPFLFGSSTRLDKQLTDQNIESLEQEKEIVRILQRKSHPNFLHTILVFQQGIFMDYLHMTLYQRLTQPALPISPQLKARWIQQIVSAVAWLAELGLAHGDLRPNNIMLDKSANLKLIDFGCTVKFGDELVTGNPPFCKLDENLNTPLAGAESETFAIGSCLFNIHFGYPPLSGIDEQEMDEKWSKHEYPPTGDDELGVIIQKCWDGEFESMAALDAVVKTLRSDENLSA